MRSLPTRLRELTNTQLHSRMQHNDIDKHDGGMAALRLVSHILLAAFARRLKEATRTRAIAAAMSLVMQLSA